MANCERYVGPVKMGPQGWERDRRMQRGSLDAPTQQASNLLPVDQRPNQGEVLQQMRGPLNQLPPVRSGGRQALAGGISW